MTKAEHTRTFSVEDYTRTMESYFGGAFDYIVWNTKRPSPLVLKRYARQGDAFVEFGKKLPGRKYVGADLVSRRAVKVVKHDPLISQRTLIRHDPDRLARLIFGIIWQEA